MPRGGLPGNVRPNVGPASPASAAGITPECYQPVLDPVARQYIEAGIVELPGCGDGTGPTDLRARRPCGRGARRSDPRRAGGPAVAEPEGPTVVERRTDPTEPEQTVVAPADPIGPAALKPGRVNACTRR